MKRKKENKKETNNYNLKKERKKQTKCLTKRKKHGNNYN